jgi:hypothetical protein
MDHKKLSASEELMFAAHARVLSPNLALLRQLVVDAVVKVSRRSGRVLS